MTLRRRCSSLASVLTCLRVDGAEHRIGLGTARATRDGQHLKRMLAMRINRIEPDLGIEAMAVAAPLVDQLAGRVGDAALFRISAQESDVPERAICRTAALATPTGWPAWKRPVRLLRRPQPLSNVVALVPDHPAAVRLA